MKYLLEGQETDRLLFRKVTWKDLDVWIDLFREEGVSKFLGMDETQTPEDRCTYWFEKVFYRYENNLGGMNALVDKKTGELVGQSGLLIQDVDEEQELEVSYSILPRHWNKGYATEAARKCRDFAFENNYADSLISIIHIENIRSEKVAKNNGMSLSKETVFKYMPVNIFRITRKAWLQLMTLILICFPAITAVCAFSSPCQRVDRHFNGRIAYSADGNYNDEDDWAASAFALAIIAEFGLQDQLVHFDYNCILPKSDKNWEEEHRISVMGAAEHFGYRNSVFFDCQKDVEGAVNNIARAVNESSANDPLFFILAGPMEVPFLGIDKADPEKRKYVYCISHSRWNDGYASGDLIEHNKRDLIPMGITWVQIADQNQWLSTGPFGRPSTDPEWSPWYWLRDSDKPSLNFLWDRLRATTRADCSDAGMAYFLMTGDERSEITKLRSLLEYGKAPHPKIFRDTLRLESENFQTLNDFEVEFRNDREVSQRINLHLPTTSGWISTKLNEPYMAKTGSYNITVRYFDQEQKAGRFKVSVNGDQIDSWQSSGQDLAWTDRWIANVLLNKGDEIRIFAESDDPGILKFDYVQLNRLDRFSVPENSKPDDPGAKPGQIIIAGSNPGYLKYNGGGPAFLCGPDNPEDFLFRGTLNPDGTRSGGMQEEMIEKMARTGVNAFHCQMFRMQRCNIKDEGNDQHSPFIDHDPSKGLDQDVLNQWDSWLGLLEQYGIVVHLEFYNDATDVELMGWELDEEGNLHPEERRFFEGIVNQFKHHKNIMWGIEESCNKLPRSRTSHFRKLGELIARTDNFNHPIVQSFVIPEDPEGDFPGGGGTSDDYIDDPNIRVVTWLHVVPHGEDFEAQHKQYLHYHNRDSRHFVVMKNETFHHPTEGYPSRRYMWSCAMTGVHTLEAYHHADRTADSTLRDDGFICKFMEKTDFHMMMPRDDLGAGSTKWVLARPGQSYIAYTYEYRDEMGISGLPAGVYDLLWFDTMTGVEVLQNDVETGWGDAVWRKPAGLGNEITLYVKKNNK